MAELLCRGARLHVQWLGAPAGRTVAFLHGLVMDNLSSWYFTAAGKVAQRARVLLYDLRGHGKSERTAAGYALEDMVADLEALLRAAQVEAPVVLVGNSFGGLLALAFARAYPERVHALALVDAHLGDESFGREMAATLGLQGEERDRKIAESFVQWRGRDSARKRHRLAETAQALVHETTLVADLERTRPLEEADLARIGVPVLALYGERSDLRERAEAQLAHLPRARIEILPGCTHSLLWEATDEVCRRVLAFVEEVG